MMTNQCKPRPYICDRWSKCIEQTDHLKGYLVRLRIYFPMTKRTHSNNSDHRTDILLCFFQNQFLFVFAVEHMLIYIVGYVDVPNTLQLIILGYESQPNTISYSVFGTSTTYRPNCESCNWDNVYFLVKRCKKFAEHTSTSIDTAQTQAYILTCMYTRVVLSTM